MGPDAVTVDIAIDGDEWLRIYEGTACRVRGRARDGRSVVFPAGILQPYMDYEGVYGTFVITYNSEGRFHSVHKIADLPKDTPSTPLD